MIPSQLCLSFVQLSVILGGFNVPDMPMPGNQEAVAGE
jgi:hypothetical protein